MLNACMTENLHMKMRSLLAVVFAALVPALVSAAPGARATPAQTSTAQQSGPIVQGLSLGGFAGYSTDDVSGLTLRADGELPFRRLAPQLGLSWAGSIGFSHLTDSAYGVDLTANVLTIVPAARFTFSVNPQFSFFGDAGLGLYYAATKAEWTDPFLGPRSTSDSDVGLMLRFQAGAFFQLTPGVRLGALIGVDPMLGDFDQNPWNLMVGAMFRI